MDTHIQGRLRQRVRLYVGISIVILAVIVYRTLSSGSNVLYSIIALAIGLSVGVFLSRMYRIEWDKDAEHVISRMDTYGTILLVAYIVFEVLGERVIRQWFQGPEILTLILSLAGGAVLGRGLGMGRRMLAVLRQNVL